MALKFECKFHPLARRAVFIKRMLLFSTFGIAFTFFSLFIGVIGYCQYANLKWIDGFYNVAMILKGMGPVANLTTDEAKVFATLYSICSSVAFLTAVGVIFAPLIHRLLHFLHQENIQSTKFNHLISS